MTDTALIADLAHELRLALADDPTALAYSIARYQAATGADDEQTSAYLLIDAATLDRLALCAPPRPERMTNDLFDIADRFRCDPDALAKIIRTARKG